MADWVVVGAVETVEEKTESFDVIDRDTGKVTGINRITSRRLIKVTDYESRTHSATNPSSSWTSEASIGGWVTGPRCTEHSYKWNPRTGLMLENKRVEGFSSWTIVGNKYEDVPEEIDPNDP